MRRAQRQRMQAGQGTKLGTTEEIRLSQLTRRQMSHRVPKGPSPLLFLKVAEPDVPRSMQYPHELNAVGVGQVKVDVPPGREASQFGQ